MVTEYIIEGDSIFNSGRASISSSYNQNCFDNILIEPVEGVETFITRYDNTDPCFLSYEGEDCYKFETIGSFKAYKRTLFRCKEGAEFTFEFNGTAVALTGNTTDDCSVNVTVDGELKDENLTLVKATHRESGYQLRGLEKGKHIVTIKVLSGTLSMDAIEVTGDTVYYPEEKAETSVETGDLTESVIKDAQVSEVENIESVNEENIPENKNGFPVIPTVIGGVAAAAAVAAGVIIAKKKRNPDKISGISE